MRVCSPPAAGGGGGFFKTLKKKKLKPHPVQEEVAGRERRLRLRAEGEAREARASESLVVGAMGQHICVFG